MAPIANAIRIVRSSDFIPAVAKHRAVNPGFGPRLATFTADKNDVPVVGGEAGECGGPASETGDVSDRPHLHMYASGNLVRRFGGAFSVLPNYAIPMQWADTGPRDSQRKGPSPVEASAVPSLRTLPERIALHYQYCPLYRVYSALIPERKE